jgi:hypothetical protein
MAELSGEGWTPPGCVRDMVEFHWFHVPVGTSLMMCVLSGEPVWYIGHFDQGRMRRCRGDLCRMCVDGVGRQIRYVVSAVELTTRRLGVLELGTAPMMVLRDAALARGALRGLVIELGRSSRSKHARLDLVVVDECPPGWAVTMEALDCRFVLDRTWDREVGVQGKAVSADRGRVGPPVLDRGG